MNIRLSKLPFGCLLMILSVSPASARTDRSRDCFGPRENGRYESCPRNTCVEGGLAHNQCCMVRSHDGFYGFGYESVDQCKCDPSVNCYRVPINPTIARSPPRPVFQPPTIAQPLPRPLFQPPTIAQPLPRPLFQPPTIAQPPPRPVFQPLTIAQPLPRPLFQPPIIARSPPRPVFQPPTIAQPLPRPLFQSPTIAQPPPRPGFQPPTIAQPLPRPGFQPPTIAQPPLRPVFQPPTIAQPLPRPLFQPPTIAQPLPRPLFQPPTIAQPLPRPLFQPPTIAQPPPRPVFQPPTIAQPLPPEAPAQFSYRDETLQTGARYCSYPFEINNFKMCSMAFCDVSGEAECCKRRGFFSVPEMCMCHPRKSCDISDLTPLEIDSDEKENSDVPECKSQEIEPDEEDPDVNDDTGKISGEESKKKSNEISDEEDDDKKVETDEKPSLCTDRLRLLNAQKVEDECRHKGVAKLTRVDADGDALVCNAIYTIAQVEGSVRRTFLTPQACGTLTKDVPEGVTLELQIGDQKYPIPSRIFTTAEGPNGNWYITPESRYANLFRDLGVCQNNACPYDPRAMRGKVDFNDCKVVSYGASNADTFETDGLREKTIAFYPGGCLEQEDFFGAKETLCFRTIDDKNAFCANDAGGPVYCRASSTKEWILLGTAAFQKDCDKYPDLKVIPFPL